MRVKIGNKRRTIKRFYFKMPSKELVNSYEAKKAQYLAQTTEDYTAELEKLENDLRIKFERKELSVPQLKHFNYRCEGLNLVQIGKKMNKSASAAGQMDKTIRRMGYQYEESKNTKKTKEKKKQTT